MTELFTITPRHIVALIMLAMSVLAVSIPNKHDHYTYFSQVIAGLIGIAGGILIGAVLFL